MNKIAYDLIKRSVAIGIIENFFADSLIEDSDVLATELVYLIEQAPSTYTDETIMVLDEDIDMERIKSAFYKFQNENPVLFIDKTEAGKWVLCSQRLPISQEQVIVSCHDDSGDTPFDYTGCGWVTTDGEYWIVDNEIDNHVIAWMPLPKPWKGDSNA